MEKLNNYILDDGDNTSLVKFLQNYNDQHLLFNFFDSSFLLYSDIDEKEKGKILYALNKTKEYFEQNREHSKIKKRNAYDHFLTLYSGSNISKKDFDNLFVAISGVCLKNSAFDVNNKIVEAINGLRDIDEPKETIMNFLYHHLLKKPFNLESQNKNGEVNFDELMLRKIAYAKASSLGRNKRDILDAVCLTYNTSTSDELIETEFIIQFLLNNCVNDELIEQPIIIVNPNPWLIRKWTLNNPLINRRIVFVLNDDKLEQLVKTLIIDKKYTFISISQLETFLYKYSNKPTDILIYGLFNIDDEDKYTLINTLIDNICHESNYLYLYDRDSFLNQETTRTGIKLDLIDQINIVPSSIPGMLPPKRRTVVRFNFSQTKDIQISKFYFNKANYSIEKRKFKTSIKKEELSSIDCIRKLFNDEFDYYEQITNKKRKAASKFAYSDEINFYYTISGNNESSYRVKAYFRDFNNDSLIIEDTVISKRFHKQDEIDKWLKEYPYTKIKDIDIQETISSLYLNEIENRFISLKTFIYIFPKLNDELPDGSKEIIKMLIDSYVGSLCIGNIKMNDLEIIYNELFSNYLKKYIFKVLSCIFKFAYQKGYCGKNIVKDLNETVQIETNEDLFYIRQSLTKKHFSKSELRVIKEKLEALKHSKHSIYISFLIRLATSLEPNIICALSWNDFKEYNVDGTKFYSLIIRKQINNSGNKIKGFDNRESYRIIPLPSAISNLLLAKKQNDIQAFSVDEEHMANCSIIFPGKEKDGLFTTVSPKELFSLNRKLVNKVVNGEDIIRVPDNKGGFIETNLEHYTGDFFKTNLYHYGCVLNELLTSSEYNYLTGTKQYDTFYSNYCDYTNEHLQLVIYKKMNKLWEIIYG